MYYDEEVMKRLTIMLLLSIFSIAALCVNAQYQIGAVVKLPPDSTLVLLDSEGKKVHEFDHENEIVRKFHTINGIDTMVLAMPKNSTVKRLPDEKLDESKLPNWFERMRKLDERIKLRQKNKNLTDDGKDHELVYENGQPVNETYSDKAMKISIISDKTTTVIDMKRGFDLDEIARNKATLARYRLYDGRKKCQSNRYDKAIIMSMRAGRISRPKVSRSNRFGNPFKTWKPPSVLHTMDFFVKDRDESAVPYSDGELDKVMPVLKPDFTLRAEHFDDFRVTWIGHSTMLIQINGLNILTDPMFSDRASPSQYFGPKRIRRPACTLDELPKIDIVLISHNHYDHLDLESIMRINQRSGSRTRWIVPLGLGSFLKYYMISNYIEMDWWQKDCQQLPPVLFLNNGLVHRQDPINAPDVEQLERLKKLATAPLAFSARSAARYIEEGGFSQNKTEEQIAIYFTPTQHGSRRGVNDYNHSLWGSFTIVSKNNATFFFGGDTGYCPAFQEIGDIFGPFAGAAIPIGAYKPRKLLRFNHIDPQEAIQVHRELRSKHSIAIHHSTFSLSYEPFDEPARFLNRLMNELRVRNGVKEPFHTIQHGQSVLFCTTCNQ